jgi:hypothetical protein
MQNEVWRWSAQTGYTNNFISVRVSFVLYVDIPRLEDAESSECETVAFRDWVYTVIHIEMFDRYRLHATVIWNVSNFLPSDTVSHPGRLASAAIPLRQLQISRSKAFPNFGNFSVSYYSTVLSQRFLTILLHCTAHTLYLISVTICDSHTQLGLAVESDRALPNCSASLSQLKCPFCT